MASALARTSRATLPRCHALPLLVRTYSSPATSLLARHHVAERPAAPIQRFTLSRQSSTAARLKQSNVVHTSSGEEAGVEEQLEENDQEDLPEFQTLEGRIHPLTLDAIVNKPFSLKTMSPVQAAVLPKLPELAEPFSESTRNNTRDLFVKARTGTGKTIAFLVPAIEARIKHIESHVKQAAADAGKAGDAAMEEEIRRAFVRREVGTLIISPTRELATQIAREAQKLTKNHDRWGVHLLVGGVSRSTQLRQFLTQRKDIVVATTGRLRDLMGEAGVLEAVSKSRTLVLDEADTLLDMGFRPDIDAICAELPPKGDRQSFMFSATVPPAIKSIAHEILSPKHSYIDCVPKDAPVVAHDITMRHTILSSASEQIPTILQMIGHDQLINAGNSKVVVFCNTTSMTRLLATMVRELARDTMPAGRGAKIYEIHSKKTQESRFNMSNRFREDTSGASVLITSDVSARGVDYPGVTRVIQVGIPSSSSQYVHRVGRTGRAGKTGRSDLILLPFEESFVGTSLNQFIVPHLSVEELQRELFELSGQFDANPTQFWEEATAKLPPPKESEAPTQARNSRERYLKQRDSRAPLGPRVYSAPITPNLKVVPDTVKAFIPSLDTQAIDEVFASSLGYYIGQISNLRCRKDDLLQGLRNWTTDACFLPTPSYVSTAFLNKIGYTTGSSSPGDKGRDRNPHWASPRNQSTYGMVDRDFRDNEGRGRYRDRDYDQSAMRGSPVASRDRGARRDYDNESSFGSRGGDRRSSFGRRDNEGGSSSYTPRDRSSSYTPRDRDSRSSSFSRDRETGPYFSSDPSGEEGGAESDSPFRRTSDRKVGQGREEYKERARHLWKGKGRADGEERRPARWSGRGQKGKASRDY